MGRRTVTRADLADAVHRKVGLPQNESARLVEDVLTYVSDALVAGESVKISSFGKFSLREKAARVGRNPKTGVKAVIEPRRVVTFRASGIMKDRIAAGEFASVPA